VFSEAFCHKTIIRLIINVTHQHLIDIPISLSCDLERKNRAEESSTKKKSCRGPRVVGQMPVPILYMHKQLFLSCELMLLYLQLQLH